MDGDPADLRPPDEWAHVLGVVVGRGEEALGTVRTTGGKSLSALGRRVTTRTEGKTNSSPPHLPEEGAHVLEALGTVRTAGAGNRAPPITQAVKTMKHVLTKKGRTMRPAVEGDEVMGTYRAALGNLMDALPGCMVAANITAAEILAHTAVAIPRTKGGALVPKGAFIKASPKEKWFTDFAILSDKKEYWFAKALCIFKVATADGQQKGFVYVRWYEQVGLCPLTTCLQLTPSRKDTRHAVVALESILRVVHICRSYSNPQLFTEFIDEYNGELHAKNERAVVLVHHPKHTLTGCVKQTTSVAGFVVDELTRVRVVQTFGVVPPCSFSALNGVVDTLKAVFRTWFMQGAGESSEWISKGLFPRPPLHDVLYKLFMAGKLTTPGTIQRSWWQAGCVLRGWVALMDRLKGKAAAGMFDCLVTDFTKLQLVIKVFKSKCSSRLYMTAWDFVGCDEDLIEKWTPKGGEETKSVEEIPAYFCIPEGPLMRDSRSCRRVVRMVHGGYVKHAESLGIHPHDVPEEVGVVNEEVVSRLRRTPIKRSRAASTSDEGITSDGSVVEPNVQRA
ncbi:unnamed protein product [Closterium sp. Naga37s-1]|nr:unnamed protein product [Closterium sp. Naga37s-1]